MKIIEFVNKITNSAFLYRDGLFSSPGRVYTFVNPYSYHLVRNNENLYNKFDGIFVDGITMCWWMKLLWNNKIPRLSFDMTSIAKDLFNYLNTNNSKTIYFIGAHQEEIEESIAHIIKSYPKINLAGYQNGYFLNETHRSNIIDEIVAKNPDYVIVGMGSPLQEQFLLDLKSRGFKGIGFTCGGFLHQTKDDINYYPKWIDKYNLRAFYRLFHEKGLYKRLYNVLIQFPVLFIYDKFFEK